MPVIFNIDLKMIYDLYLGIVVIRIFLSYIMMFKTTIKAIKSREIEQKNLYGS
jgi:hypothetical protein